MEEKVRFLPKVFPGQKLIQGRQSRKERRWQQEGQPNVQISLFHVSKRERGLGLSRKCESEVDEGGRPLLVF